MKKIIVSDASPLIALAKLNHLELLFAAFSEIHIPNAVYVEATHDRHRQDSQIIHDFIETQPFVLIHQDQANKDYQAFKNILDEGESQALALSTKLSCGILIDERLGRIIAKQEGIHVVGVMGVLLHAKFMGKITAIKPLIDKLQQENYRLSDRLITFVLNKAGE